MPLPLEPTNPKYPSPEDFRDKALKQFQELARIKFDKGQREHGGNIIDRWLINEAKNEVIDLWFYISALEQKLITKRPFEDE